MVVTFDLEGETIISVPTPTVLTPLDMGHLKKSSLEKAIVSDSSYFLFTCFLVQLVLFLYYLIIITMTMFMVL